MNSMQEKLKQAFNNLFDKNTPGYLPDYLPSHKQINEELNDLDLLRPIPAIGEVLEDSIPIGNANVSILDFLYRNINSVKISDNHNTIKLDGELITVIINFTKVSVLGYWVLSQKVNQWTTHGWGPFKIPKREELTKLFKGIFEAKIEINASAKLKLILDSNSSDPPKILTDNISTDLFNFSVNFDGSDSLSKQIAEVMLSHSDSILKLNDKIKEIFINDILSQIKSENIIGIKLEEALARIWAEE